MALSRNNPSVKFHRERQNKARILWQIVWSVLLINGRLYTRPQLTFSHLIQTKTAILLPNCVPFKLPARRCRNRTHRHTGRSARRHASSHQLANIHKIINISRTLCVRIRAYFIGNNHNSEMASRHTRLTVVLAASGNLWKWARGRARSSSIDLDQDIGRQHEWANFKMLSMQIKRPNESSHGYANLCD